MHCATVRARVAHLLLVVRAVGVAGDQKVELDVALLVCQNPAPQAREANSTLALVQQTPQPCADGAAPLLKLRAVAGDELRGFVLPVVGPPGESTGWWTAQRA